MNFTRTQLNYILAIKQLSAGLRSQKNISELLGVKRSSACVALKSLEDGGFVHRRPDNEYCLTEKTMELLTEVEEEQKRFMALFHGRLGIDAALCDRQYYAVCGLMEKEFLLAAGAPQDKSGRFYGLPGPGRYSLPFVLSTLHGDLRSMGDRGFVHPAVLEIGDNSGEILLEAKEIYYRSKSGSVFHGRLNSLSYFDSDLGWISAKSRDENLWILPTRKIFYRFDDRGVISLGTVKIRAEATTSRMPVSVAELTFNFRLLEKIDD